MSCSVLQVRLNTVLLPLDTDVGWDGAGVVGDVWGTAVRAHALVKKRALRND